jgi:hypothetical protein
MTWHYEVIDRNNKVIDEGVYKYVDEIFDYLAEKKLLMPPKPTLARNNAWCGVDDKGLAHIVIRSTTIGITRMAHHVRAVVIARPDIYRQRLLREAKRSSSH